MKDKTNIHRTITSDIFFHYTPECPRNVKKKRKEKKLLKEWTIESFSCYDKMMVASTNFLLVAI